MSNYNKAIVFAVTLTALFAFPNTVNAKENVSTTTVPKNESIYVIQSNTDSHTYNFGKNQYVTKKVTTGYTLNNQQPNYQDPVSIPKNVVLTVVKRMPNENGYLVSVPGSSENFFINNINDYTYSTKTIKLTKNGQKKLLKDSFKWSKTLNKKEIKALQYYTGNGYVNINTALRNPNENITKKINQKINLIKYSIGTFELSSPLTVYRGVSLEGLRQSLSGVKTIADGDQYQDHAFSSTSINKMIAVGFSSKVILKINLPAGYHGAYIDPISENKGEKEYLLKNNTKLITTKIQKVKTHTISTMGFIKTNTKGKVISQKIKKHNSNGAYWLITLNLQN
ncbi:ADP-ribosyltransferase [uncultured Lentilactobacillus sp.]|uniref:ADP-ribosyltransferase n=1 Tax=uncultured Lentilactobacillus sp. TaxID=2805375 RepID=UPI002596BA9E|nr:ADP-ribosyltransferase [uncultured Lentilactobacillus sp.]